MLQKADYRLKHHHWNDRQGLEDDTDFTLDSGEEMEEENDQYEEEEVMEEEAEMALCDQCHREGSKSDMFLCKSCGGYTHVECCESSNEEMLEDWYCNSCSNVLQQEENDKQLQFSFQIEDQILFTRIMSISKNKIESYRELVHRLQEEIIKYSDKFCIKGLMVLDEDSNGFQILVDIDEHCYEYYQMNNNNNNNFICLMSNKPLKQIGL
jgi:RecJ-like exonuclease